MIAKFRGPCVNWTLDKDKGVFGDSSVYRNRKEWEDLDLA